MTGVDDLRQRPLADEQPGDRLDRALRRREADPDRACLAQRFEPLERERKVRAALVTRDGMDLVDDHHLDSSQRGPAAGARDQEVERLGRRHEEARRFARHPRAFRVRRVAGTNRDPDIRGVESELTRDLRDLPQRTLEVLGDVDGERFQRRHVDDACDVLDRLAGVVREVQPVDADEEAGQRLARTGRRRDERVGTGGDVRPGGALRCRGPFGESTAKPRADGRMEPVDLGLCAQHELARGWDQCCGHRVILASPVEQE